MPHRTSILVAAAVIAIVALLAWSFRPQPVAVDIVQASNGPLTVSIREQARTRVKDRFEITAPIAAFASRMEWQVGDPVAEGQTLIVLRPIPSSVLDPRSRQQAEAGVSRAEAAMHAAEASLQAARSTAELAASEYRRLQPLHGQGSISANELDRARSDHEQAQAGLRSTEFNLEVARQDLRHARAALVQGERDSTGAPGQFVIESPVAGRILHVHHESAGVVQPGQALLEIGDPQSLEVIAEVLTQDAVRLDPGMRVELDRWGGDRRLIGVIRCIEPSGFTKISALGVEEQRTRVVVDLVSPREHWQRLGRGFRLEARFIVWHGERVPGVPHGAVFRHADGHAVFTVAHGRARLTPVTVGRRGELRTEIHDGLQTGTKVIVHPDNEVVDGVRVAAYQPRGGDR